MDQNEKKKKRRKLYKHLFWRTLIICFALCIFLEIKYPKVLDDYIEFGVINTYLCLILAMLPHIVLHEAGHLICGLLSGYKILALSVFNFQIKFQNGNIKFKRYSIPGAAGYCIMVPPEAKNGKYPFVLTMLGGSLMNIILAVLFGTMLFIQNQSFGFYFYCVLMTVTGLIFSVFNLVPIPEFGVSSDGMKLSAMRKSEKERAAFYTMGKITEATFLGMRPKDMPEEWFFVPSDEEMQNHLLSGIGVDTAIRMLDQGKTEEADQLMAHFLSIPSGMTNAQRYGLTCSRLCTEMMGENRPEVIEQLYTKELAAYLKRTGNTLAAIQTQYIHCLLVQRDQQKADQFLKKFESIAKRYPFPQDVESCRVVFAKAREKAQLEETTHG